MNSRVAPYGDPATHQPLAEMLPLSTPLSLLIDPANACNFRCKFCPTAYPGLLTSVSRPKGLMEYELFCRIIDGLAEFPQKVRKLHLYKDGEPFLNKRLPDMIAYAKAHDAASSIETTTNGSLLAAETIHRILDAGLDRIRISIEHVHSEGYRSITGCYDDYSTIVNNVTRLFTEKAKRSSTLQVHVKLVDIGFTDEEKAKFFNDFGDIADEAFIDEVMGWSDSGRFDFTLGRIPEVGMTRSTPIKTERVVCPQPFYTLAVNFNGVVSVCCVDWTMNTVVGDCRTQSLRTIWNGPGLKQFRLMHLRGQREMNQACRNCQYVLGMSDASDLDRSSANLYKLF
jgi:radical SAM protein with 4Fe4S-binding SPASM domain